MSDSVVDLDLLADYTCGELAGEDEARVAALITDDPAWASAHAALTGAEPLIQHALSELAAEDEPMPAEVREAVLAALPAAPAGSLAVRRYRRARRWTVAAAAVVVLAGGGTAVGFAVQQAGGGGDATSSVAAGHASGSGSPNRMGANANAPDLARSVPVAASGADYTAATLASAADVAGASALASAALPRVPDALTRLTAGTALVACLGAVASKHPGTPEIVDYARYEGRPALIVVTDSGTVVAGPECGVSGADIRYQTSQ